MMQRRAVLTVSRATAVLNTTKITLIGTSVTTRITLQHQMLKWHVLLAIKAVLIYKTLNTSVSNCHVNARTLPLMATTLLNQLFARTDFVKRSFRCTAQSVRNSLPASVIECD